MIDTNFDEFLSASPNDMVQFEDLDVGGTFVEDVGEVLWIKVSDHEAFNVATNKLCTYSQIAENPWVIPCYVRAEVI